MILYIRVRGGVYPGYQLVLGVLLLRLITVAISVPDLTIWTVNHYARLFLLCNRCRNIDCFLLRFNNLSEAPVACTLHSPLIADRDNVLFLFDDTPPNAAF